VAHEDKAIGRGGEQYVYTNMKQVIDYNRRTIRIKHQQRSVTREVFCNIIITTNNAYLFPWDSNERRFFAPQKIVHRVSKEESGEFLARFHEFLQLPEVPALLNYWLSNVDLEGFDYGRCPLTPYMQELIGSSGSMLDHALDDFLEGRDIFHPTELAHHLTGLKQSQKAEELKAALEVRGFEYQRMKFRAEGMPDDRFRVWRKSPGPRRHFRDLTPEESLKIMEWEGGTY
jgi:hypothetical protein